MTPVVAQALLEAALRLPAKALTMPVARSLLVVWLRARGLVEDRWGNFALPDGGRYHFSAHKLHRQAKPTGGGDWYDLDGLSLIETATVLMKKAAEIAGSEAEKARWTGAREARKEAKVKTATRVEVVRLDLAARRTAQARLAYERPAEVAASYRRAPLPEEVVRDLTATFDRYVGEAKARLDANPKADPLAGITVATVARPPILPLFEPWASVAWTEDVGGVPYTVRVAPHDRGRARIEIGATGAFGMGVDPFTGGAKASLDRYRATGDAYVSGSVTVDAEGRRNGALYLIQSHKPGAGLAAGLLWCRLMAGYGIPIWVGRALQGDGRRLLDVLVKARALVLEGERGSDVFVRCALDRRGSSQLYLKGV